MDTLSRVRQKLNIDQRNLANATVISTSENSAKIRLLDGTERRAFLPEGIEASSGDLVQVSIIGNQATVQGATILQDFGAEKTVWL